MILAGTWQVIAGKTSERGNLIVEVGIFNASFKSPNVNCEELRLIESESCIVSDGSKTNTLVYGGDTDRWDDCHDDFVVELKLYYKPDDTPDTIQGVIYVTPLNGSSSNRRSYDPSSSGNGGEFTFTATRQ